MLSEKLGLLLSWRCRKSILVIHVFVMSILANIQVCYSVSYDFSDSLKSPEDGALLRRSYRRDPVQEDYIYEPHEEDEGVIIEVVDEEGQVGKSIFSRGKAFVIQIILLAWV